MHNVIPNLLWTGHAGDARDGRAIVEAEIKAVVDLAYEEPPSLLPRDVVYCRFPLIDGAGNDPWILGMAVETVIKLIDAGIPTLVSCSNGMSRSPSITAAALSVHRGQSPHDCLVTLAQSRSHDVSLPFWEDVVKACGYLGRS